ncbi:unnamed protein product, partial [Allacma fusca]
MVRAYVQSRNKDQDGLSRGPVLAGIIFGNIGSKKLPSNIKYTLRLPSYQRTKYNGFTDRNNFRPSWFTDSPYPILSFGGPRSKDNSFGGFPGYFEEGFLYLQQAVDNALMMMLLNKTQFEKYSNYSLKMSRFPYPPSSHDKYLLISQIWIPYLFGIAYVYSVMNLTRQIIHEKLTRLKEFMKIMGLANWQHWTTWFARSFAVLLVVSIMNTILLKAEFKDGISVLPKSNPILVFAILLLYGLHLITFAFLCSTLFSS